MEGESLGGSSEGIQQEGSVSQAEELYQSLKYGEKVRYYLKSCIIRTKDTLPELSNAYTKSYACSYHREDKHQTIFEQIKTSNSFISDSQVYFQRTRSNLEKNIA